MPGAFEVSLEDGFDLDALRTEEEIQRCGEEVLEWLENLATSQNPPATDIRLLREIHHRWFSTTFPVDAGRERTEMVLNRKGRAVAVEAIIPGIENACGNWHYRHENFRPEDPLEEIRFIVSEANGLAVALYEVHPFLDGNTRATWHIRNYVLMRDGLRPLIEPTDEDAYLAAWWAASPFDHAALDDLVLDELAADDR